MPKTIIPNYLPEWDRFSLFRTYLRREDRKERIEDRG